MLKLWAGPIHLTCGDCCTHPDEVGAWCDCALICGAQTGNEITQLGGSGPDVPRISARSGLIEWTCRRCLRLKRSHDEQLHA